MFNENAGSSSGPSHAAALDTLARARLAELKAFAEGLLERMGDIRVVRNRSGLVMLPMRDTVRHVDFHLGEVLVSEALVEDAGGHRGYGMTTGRDLERAMAMAVVDLALAAGLDVPSIEAFITREHALQEEADTARLRRVEATRVEMETF